MKIMSQPKNAEKKESIENPGKIQATSASVKALTIKRNRPSVKRVMGRVRIIRTGLTTALMIPRRNAAIKSVKKLCTWIPGTIYDARPRLSALIRRWVIKFIRPPAHT